MTNNITEIQFINTFGQVGPQGKIVVDTNTQMAINFAVSDIKDPFSRKGTKSYKFTVLGTKENNQLLNNYYDINILDGTYNHNHKQRVAILRNGIVVVDNAYMQLLAINKTAVNGTYNDQLITYEVEIGNSTTGFFTDITNKYLTDLDFSDMNHDYNSTNVVDSFTHDCFAIGGGGYKYVLPYIKAGNQYALEEMKPAISVYEYWNRIHHAAGYTWDWDEYKDDSVMMDRLWVPYNGEIPSIDTSPYEVAVENSTAIGNLDNPPGAVAGNIFPISPTLANLGWPIYLDNVVQDLQGDWYVGLTDSWYVANLFFGISSLDFSLQITYSLELENTTAGSVYWINQNGVLPFIPNILPYKTYIRWGYNGSSSFSPLSEIEEIDIIQTSQAGGVYTLNPGWNTIQGSHTVTTPWFTNTNVASSDTLQPRIGAWIGNSSLNGFNWRDNTVNGNLALVNSRLVVSDVKLIIKPRFETYAYATHLKMNSFVPKQVKQSDFIKGICNMYNLIADIDPTNDRKIIYKQRDSYYDAGATKDWTSKFVADKESKINFISDSNKKKVILTYKDDKDITNTEYKKGTKETYGQLQYTLENENIKDIDRKEIVFSPSPIMLTTFEAYCPVFDDTRAPKTNIRVLLDGGLQECKASFRIIDYGGLPGGNAGTSDTGFQGYYPMLTHQDNPKAPMFDINFGLCDFYYFPFDSQTNNNLYSMFWRRTINQIDTGKTLTCYIQLDEYDISSLKMNDKIWIKDTWYNINSLTYDPNSTGPSKVVLTTIDYQLKLYPTKDPAHQSTESSHYDIIHQIAATRKDAFNYNYSDGTSLTLGVGNIINENVKNILVVGNNIAPEMSNAIYTDNLIATNIYNLNTAGNITTLNQINNVVEILYADLAALKAAGELIPNTTYFIIDRGYWVTAATVDRLDTFGKRIMNIPLSSMYVPSGTILGIWQSTLTPTSGDTVVWGGQAWKNLTGAVGSFISNSDLDATNWAPRPHYDLSYYEDKIFLIQYDFDNDWISRQADDRGNVLGFWDSTFTTPNPIDITDWNDLSIKNNTNFGGIFNNAIVNGIYNNLNAGSIYNNTSNGIIFNNSNSSHIYGNANAGDINNNTNTGEISFNFNNGRISANSNIGDITFNSNNGGILVNTNVGTIDFNSAPVTTILRNSNNGYISSNSNTGNIENNSNTADINNNSNIGGILSNSSVGGIFDNTNNGRIFSNSNLGTITTNSNNGEITLNANTESIDTNSNDGDIIHNLNNGTIYLNSNIGAIIANSNGGNILQNSTIGEIELNVNSKDIGPNTQTSGTCKIKFNNNNGDISGARTVDVLGTVVNI